MPLAMVGLNHRTAPVDLREQFCLTGCGIPMALEELKSHERFALDGSDIQ